MKEEKKILYLEVLRIVALLAIVFNHTSIDGFFLFTQEELFSMNSWIYCFFSIGCKFGVYVFFMISGALLLGKDESLETVLKKRVLKYVVIFIVWEAINYCYLCLTGSCEFGIIYFFKILYSYDLSFNFSYWFLVSYICFLMALPILRAIVRRIDKKTYIYVFVIFAVFEIANFLPLISSFPYRNPNINIDWLSPIYIIYPLLGYYLHTRIEDLNVKKLVIMIVFSVLSIIMCSYFTMMNMTITGNLEEWNDNQLFHTSFVLLQSSTIFLLVKKVISNMNITEVIYKIITTCSSLVFGIYLLHLPVIKSNLFAKVLSFFKNGLSINCMLSCWITCLIIILILGLLTWFLKKIPYINKLI